jgi:hypothetical protein
MRRTPRRKTEADRIDDLISEIYRLNCAGITINVLDISTVFKAGHAAWTASGTREAVEAAVLAKVQEVRTG